MEFKEMDIIRRKQVEMQVAQFEDRFKNATKDYDSVDIVITPEFTLKNYLVHRDVFQSDRMTAVDFARWINYNNDEYSGRTVLDMFCGGGIQGIVALIKGAEHVIFVDNSEEACKNTLENLTQYGLMDRATVIQSDLFEEVNTKADIIIANPPFFPCDGIEDKLISKTMCIPTQKLEEFYQNAILYSPKIVVCHWDFAGIENDPERIGPKYGWNVERKLCLGKGYGLQQVSDNKYLFKVDMLSRYGGKNE